MWKEASFLGYQKQVEGLMTAKLCSPVISWPQRQHEDLNFYACFCTTVTVIVQQKSTQIHGMTHERKSGTKSEASRFI